MSRSSLVAAFISLGVLMGCSRDSLVQPDAPTLQSASGATVISDGSHGGNAHFYFLPPMLKATSHAGTFDATRSPVVRITEGGATLVELNAVVSVDAEQYHVNWHTRDFNLDAAKAYRITVLVDGFVLGFADVDVVSSGGQLRNVNTGEYVPLLDGRTLPIKFRIEDGAVGWRQISAGGGHTCGLTVAGAAYCWGDNSQGQLGDGTMENRLVPTLVTGGQVFTAVEAGGGFSCALSVVGTVFCWGANYSGQLGDATATARSVPAPVSGGHVFAAVFTGYSHACALKATGAAYCWGINLWGTLGTGLLDYVRSEPTPVRGDHRFTSLALGYQHTCGLTSPEATYCWGRNDYGQSGNNPEGSPPQSSEPVRMTFGQAFVSATAGGSHTCGVTSSGEAYCWGSNFDSQIGNPAARGPVPAAVLGGLTFSSLSAALSHTCGLSPEGVAYCWGSAASGRIGDGTIFPGHKLSPTLVSGGHLFHALDTGTSHTCGLTAAGDAYCWGGNGGALGDGTSANSFVPTLVLPPLAP